ncbi:DMT family transporter [Wukongibacter sp. M2B1]|uniref:DMT family transporter n=1 Tax=Wukongibacter sp. M2B1 TaxID=3088895 RepID=UPI003D7B65AE
MDENSNKKRIYADFMLLIVAILWGSTFVATKTSLTYLSPLYILAVRFLIAFGVMAVSFWKKFKIVKKYDLFGGFIVGTVIFFAFLTQTIGLIFTTAGKQAFLAGTYVVMVPFLYWILYKKRPDMRSFLGAIICFIGISLLTLNSSFQISFGDSLTIFSSLLFAAHIISNGYFVEKMDATVLTIIQFGAAGVWALLAALILEPIPMNIPL